MRIRIGTRSSHLALSQVRVIADEILSTWPDAEIIPVPIRTSGDRNLSPFTSDPKGIKGMFTREIEQALRRGEIDIAVHSLKDLPVNVSPDLPIIAYSRRGCPFDVLVGSGHVIGTSSSRRKAQLSALYPEAEILPVRGNIGTRLRKLEAGEYTGLVLACAGLERLGLTHMITRTFTADEVMPSPGQGILACQGRAGEDYGYLSCVNDEASRDCGIAERSFAREIGAACNIPAGAYAEIEGDILTLRGIYAVGGEIRRGELSGSRYDAESIGVRLAGMIG